MVALSSLMPQAIFNGAGSAGPRRLAMIGGTAIAMIAAVAGASMIGHKTQEPSHAAPMPYINPLPGGLNSNAEQDALARVDAQARAKKALASGQSYTPPMAASQPFKPPPVVQAPPPAAPAPPARPAAMPPPAAPFRFEQEAAAPPAAAPARPVVQAAADGQTAQSLRDQLNRLFQGYGGEPPRTEMVIDGTLQPAAATTPAGAVHAADGQPPAQTERQVPKHVLVPSGRGVYAHTILAVSSDSGGPIVLQADSGPIAGDRMIGSFATKGDRLVVAVQSLIHGGESLGVNGLVIAPDSMETAVASSVDEHYASRLLLPVAAAFIQGLGQSIATSNTTSQIGALGTATGFTHLDLAQQAGVGVGVAGAKVGQFLTDAAPKGPTVNLASNVNVAVVFLAEVAVAK